LFDFRMLVKLSACGGLAATPDASTRVTAATTDAATSHWVLFIGQDLLRR
jgi:hypothetical protein